MIAKPTQWMVIICLELNEKGVHYVSFANGWELAESMISGLKLTDLIFTVKQKALWNGIKIMNFVIMSLPFTVCQKINSDANTYVSFIWVSKKPSWNFCFSGRALNT